MELITCAKGAFLWLILFISNTYRWLIGFILSDMKCGSHCCSHQFLRVFYSLDFEMASVIYALVSDWCVSASIRLQLHLPPGVREPGPTGLQPAGQRAWTNPVSQKPLLLHSPSTQGERSKHTKESYFCEEMAFESYLWHFPGHRWRVNTFIWEWVCWTLILCYFAEVYVSHDWIMAGFIPPHRSKPTLLHNLLHNMLFLLLLLLLLPPPHPPPSRLSTYEFIYICAHLVTECSRDQICYVTWASDVPRCCHDLPQFLYHLSPCNMALISSVSGGCRFPHFPQLPSFECKLIRLITILCRELHCGVAVLARIIPRCYVCLWIIFSYPPLQNLAPSWTEIYHFSSCLSYCMGHRLSSDTVIT